MFWTRKAVRTFSRQLAMLLEEDVPLQVAVHLIACQHRSKRWSRMLNQISKELDCGRSLSNALSPYRAIFSRGYVEVIAWAEGKGGVRHLVTALRLLADDTAPRTSHAPATAGREDEDLDRFARALRG